MKILSILANPKATEQSACLRIEQAFRRCLEQRIPQADIEIFNTYTEDIPLLDWDTLGPFFGAAPASDAARQKMERRTRILEQFLAADVYIFTFPMWNFSVPPMLKAYMDCVLVARKTFRYTPNGPAGLLEGRRAVVISSAGSRYDGDLASIDMAGNLMMHYCKHMGIADAHRIRAEGYGVASPEEAESITRHAIAAAEMLAADLRF